MSDNKRATGRTFRMMVKAIGMASEGKNVVMVFDSEFAANICRSRAHKMMDGYDWSIATKVNKTVIEFPNGAMIGFATTGVNVGFVTGYIHARNDGTVTTLTDHNII